MNHHYKIIPKGKKSYLYRIESGTVLVALAFADDLNTMFQLVRMKKLFEDEKIPLEELHAAEALGKSAKKSYKPSWTSVNLVGGNMEVWEISDCQAKVLRQIKDKKKDGLHSSVVRKTTVNVLLKHGLVQRRRKYRSYLTITDEGNNLLGRIDR